MTSGSQLDTSPKGIATSPSKVPLSGSQGRKSSPTKDNNASSGTPPVPPGRQRKNSAGVKDKDNKSANRGDKAIDKGDKGEKGEGNGKEKGKGEKRDKGEKEESRGGGSKGEKGENTGKSKNDKEGGKDIERSSSTSKGRDNHSWFTIEAIMFRFGFGCLLRLDCRCRVATSVPGLGLGLHT